VQCRKAGSRFERPDFENQSPEKQLLNFLLFTLFSKKVWPMGALGIKFA